MSAVAPLIPGAFIAALARRGDSHGGSLTCLATASLARRAHRGPVGRDLLRRTHCGRPADAGTRRTDRVASLCSVPVPRMSGRSQIGRILPVRPPFGSVGPLRRNERVKTRRGTGGRQRCRDHHLLWRPGPTRHCSNNCSTPSVHGGGSLAGNESARISSIVASST